MSDLLRKQILHARRKLTDTTSRVDEAWITELIGDRAVRAIKADAKRRTVAELARRGVIVPQYPAAVTLADLGLSDAALAYWNSLQEAEKAEPPLNWYKPVAIMRRLTKVKIRVPKQIRFIGDHVAFSPKLNKRDDFVAGLRRIVDAYEQLPENERAKFTTDGAPELGGLRFPRPLRFAELEKAQAAYRQAAAEADAVRDEVTRQAWLDGLDKAAGRYTGTYKVGGRLSVETEVGDEQSD